MSPRFRLKFLEDGKDLQKVISKKWYPITTWSIDLTYKFLKLKTNTLYFTWICWNYHQFVWEHVGCRTSAVLGMRPFLEESSSFFFHATSTHDFIPAPTLPQTCMSSEERLDASRIVIILVGRHRWQKSEYPPNNKHRSGTCILWRISIFLFLSAPVLTGMVQSYTFIPSHNILIPLAIGSFHRLQRMVTKRVSSWRVAHLYLISYMFPKVKEGFSRIYIKFLKGKCPKVVWWMFSPLPTPWQPFDV